MRSSRGSSISIVTDVGTTMRIGTPAMLNEPALAERETIVDAARA